MDVLDSAQTLLKIRLASPVRDAVTGEVTESTALVPFVDELVPDIDLEEGYLTIDPPGGLIPDRDSTGHPSVSDRCGCRTPSY